eukprot:7506983-Ditylum_brightwellii.AAC.1
MDAFLQAKILPEEIKQLNYCRLYLCITHVSDKATSGGKQLHPLMLTNDPDKLLNPISMLNWLIQGNPNVLKQPLGHWIHMHNTWNAYYDSTQLEQHITCQITLYYVSDGGEDDGLGYFGWMAINNLLSELPENMKVDHVKGYQDPKSVLGNKTKSKKKEELTCAAKLNIHADNLATMVQCKAFHNIVTSFIPLPDAKAYLLINK